MRAFFAIPSEPMWVESARGLVERLRSRLPRASWTRPETWHLTLKFLGDVDEGFVSRFAEAIAPAAFETVSGEIQAGTAVIFPGPSRPRVLGVGFRPSPALESLSALAARAEKASSSSGGEPRPFHAHVTFARIRESGWPSSAVDEYRREVESWPFPPWRVRSCVLFESRLEPAGAVHMPLQEWTFQGGPRGVRA